MKKIILIIVAMFLLSSCQALTDKTGIKSPEFKKPFKKCPPKGERTLKDILCKE